MPYLLHFINVYWLSFSLGEEWVEKGEKEEEE